MNGKLMKKVHAKIEVIEGYAKDAAGEMCYTVAEGHPDVCRWAVVEFCYANPLLQFRSFDPGDMSTPWTDLAASYLFVCFIEHISTGDYQPAF